MADTTPAPATAPPAEAVSIRIIVNLGNTQVSNVSVTVGGPNGSEAKLTSDEGTVSFHLAPGHYTLLATGPLGKATSTLDVVPSSDILTTVLHLQPQ